MIAFYSLQGRRRRIRFSITPPPAGPGEGGSRLVVLRRPTGEGAGGTAEDGEPLLFLLLALVLSDEVLVRRYQDGKVRALEELYHRYKTPVLSFLTRMIGDRGDAEDAFTETWAKIARALPDYEEQGRFRSFLFTVARREAYHVFERRSFRDSRAALSLDGDSIDELATSESSPEEEAAGTQLAGLLQAELANLSDELRTCFLLYHVEDLTVPEVAEATDLSPATVKRRIGSARRLLAARLTDLAPEVVT